MSAGARSLGRRPVAWAGRLPAVILLAIAGAWAFAIAAQAAGAASLLHHDTLIAGAPTAGALLLFMLAWQVMIAAMMLPTALPLIRLYRVAAARQPRAGLATLAFVGGYAIVWSTFGALAFGFDIGIHAAIDSSAWLSAHAWLLGGTVLALAGGFQFTSLKDACLDKCRHPAQFLRRFYRRGAGGGFALGARHGIFCVGCCWALMLVMFAAGVASLVWMALLTALMVHEKTAATGRRAVPVTGVALLGAASVVLAYQAYANGVV